jgi:hypothetical protein
MGGDWLLPKDALRTILLNHLPYVRTGLKMLDPYFDNYSGNVFINDWKEDWYAT